MKRTLLFTILALGLALSGHAASGGNGGGGGGNGGGGGGAGHGASASSAGKSMGAQKSAEHRANKADADQGAGSVAQQLARNPALANKLAGLVPAGTSLVDAAEGFSNLGQFVASLHVSKNLSLSFADLKSQILGGKSLGASIQSLKPGVNSETEATRARQQADQDLR
ncbi:MAG TPA: hypothetical protein VFY31_05595 [Macromonas sp.]|nr:hypothetical protein [Macromonas sp.]